MSKTRKLMMLAKDFDRDFAHFARDWQWDKMLTLQGKPPLRSEDMVRDTEDDLRQRAKAITALAEAMDEDELDDVMRERLDTDSPTAHLIDAMF